MRQELLIAQTWDGDAVPENERATLSLHLSSTALQISVEAPFYGDPAPSPSPGSTWELWNFEVVELFVLGRSEERYLEVELGPHGIRSNAIAPGTTLTGPVQETTGNRSLATITRANPMRRLAQPADIAGAVLFLASDLASYVNGQCLSVDGGFEASVGVIARADP